ncbi:MAG: PQQ-binding-like beta-propeller repeat protein, partial [Planctomycetota bacterium]
MSGPAGKTGLAAGRAFGLAALLCAATLVCGSDWPHHGFDDARTRASSEIIGAPLVPEWSVPAAAGGIVSSPAVADGVLVVGTRDRRIRGFRESDGQPLWTVNTGDEVIGSPTIHQGRAYVCVSDGTLRCLGVESGASAWTYTSTGTHMSSPVASGSTLYFGAGFPERELQTLDTSDGSPGWSVTLDQVTYASPAVDSGRVYFADNSGNVRAFTTAGAPVWSYPTAGKPLLSSPMVSGDFIYALPGGEDPKLYKIHNDDATWPGTNAQCTVTDPAVPNPGAQYALNKTQHAVSSPVLAGNRIVFVLRFDYFFDDTTDFALVTDLIVMREFYVGVDPATMTADWRTLLRETTTADQNQVPPLSLCPSPARFQNPAAQTRVAVG